MEVNELGILVIRCDACIFQCLPGTSFGWGLYAGPKEIMQHYGWGEGIEWDHNFAGFTD